MLVYFGRYMNRRTFTKLIGSAIIGTVLVLKLPDSIAPIFGEWSLKVIEANYEPEFVGVWNYKDLLNQTTAKPITYSTLEKIFKEAMKDRSNPNYYLNC